MGTPDFAVTVLEKLIASEWNIVAAITQPDQKVGRRQILTPSAIKYFAKKQNFPVLEIASLKNKDNQQKVLRYQPDLIIVCAFGLILPKEILEFPRFQCLNIHASLLPKYRGASPIQFTLLNGDHETGITIIKMVEGLDSGGIVAQNKISISANDNYLTLSVKLADLGADSITAVLPDWIEGKIKTISQDEKLATTSKILTREDGQLNWHDSKEEINNKIRAFFPWPGTFTYINAKSGKKRLKIVSADLLLNGPKSEKKPGLLQAWQNQLVVETGNGHLLLKQVQLEGEKKVSGEIFAKRLSQFPSPPRLMQNND